MVAVTQHGYTLLYASPELKEDREVVLRAVTQNGHALEYASQELQGDREVVLRAVTQNGHVLKHASQKLRADREVVMAAVTQNADVLYYASEALKADIEIVMAAVTQNGIVGERRKNWLDRRPGGYNESASSAASSAWWIQRVGYCKDANNCHTQSVVTQSIGTRNQSAHAIQMEKRALFLPWCWRKS